jgi:K+ transporter
MLPLSLAIIIGIFVIQQHGTHRVGGLFGPIMVAIQLGYAPRLDIEHTSSHEMGQIIVTHRRGMAIWREKLFVVMARNAVRATAFFRLPPERVVELGVQVEI